MSYYPSYATEEASLPLEASTASEFQSSLEGETNTQEGTLSYLETVQTETAEEEGAGAALSTLERQKAMAPPSPRRRKTPFILSGVAAALLLLLAAGGLKLSQALAKEEEQLPLIDDELDGLFTDLDMRTRELIERWNAASDDVKKAFAAHYLPSVEGMEADPKEGLALYTRHVEGLKRVRVPAHEDEEKRLGYLRNVRTLTAVLTAATERLKGLEGLNQIYTESKVEANMLMKPDPSPLPTKEELLQQSADMLSFEDFVQMLPGVSAPQNAPQKEQMIPRVLAEKVANLLRVQYKMHDEDFAIQEIFQNYFFSSYDLNLMNLTKEQTAGMKTFGIGYDQMHFNSPAVANFLLYRHQHPGRVLLNQELMEECAQNFTVEGMLGFLEKVREIDGGANLVKERRFAMSNARYGPPPSKGHLASLALFLI